MQLNKRILLHGGDQQNTVVICETRGGYWRRSRIMLESFSVLLIERRRNAPTW